MQHVLPLLIERAGKARDRQATLLREAELALAQACQTQAQLADFRAGCLQRAPGHQGKRADSTTLAAYQTFVQRLDQVVELQHGEEQRRGSRADAARQALLESQRRVLAFEALGRRLADRRQTAAARQAQRGNDEHALRQAFLQMKDKRP